MMGVVRSLLSPHDENGKPKPVELILPDDDDLIAQLSGRKYSMTDDSRQRVESKDAIKKEEAIHRMKRIVFYYAAFLLDLRKKGDARLEQEK